MFSSSARPADHLEFLDLRLVGGSHDCEGRLEVYYNGSCGSVCNNVMPEDSISVICRHLSCGSKGHLLTAQETFGKGNEPFWVDHINCHKGANFLWQCPSSPWNITSCDDRDLARIVCEERKPKTQLPGNCPTSEPCSDRDRVRLTNNCSGRVEVYYQGGWGTVCDDDWDMKDAEVICRQLGCGPAMNATGGALHGSGTGPIWLSEVNCRGYEQVLQDCWALRWNMSDCLHKEDAGAVCMDNYPPPTTVTTSDLGRLQTIQPPSYIPTVFLVVFIFSVTLVGMGIIAVGVLIKRMKRYKRALRNMYSVSSQEPVYEEIDLRMMKKYQSVSQESVFYPDGLDEKLEYYTSEERHHMMPEPGSSLENKMTEYDDTGLSYENLNNDETTTDGSKGICKQSQVRKSSGRKKTRKSSEKEEDLGDDSDRR